MTLDLVKEYLENEGYRPRIDDDGDLLFRAEGYNFIYFANSNDQDFFQLSLPGIMDVTPDNREMVLEVCNAVTLEIKVAKCCVINNSSSVWLFFENLLDRDPKVEDIMPRAISILFGALRTFREKMR